MTLTIAMLVSLAGRASAQPAVDLGAAGTFGLLGLEGVKISMSHARSGVTGDVGLGPGGVQNFSNGFITGTFFVDPTADNNKGNNVVIGGGTVVQDLTGPVSDALAAAAQAGALVPTQTFGVIDQALTIVGNGGLNVIAVEGIQFSSATDKLTLEGGASDVFVIQVAGSVKLSHKLSAIQVSGALSESRVLFYLPGGGTPLSLSGGAKVVGTFLVPNGKVTLSPGTVTGAVIAGGDVALPSGGQIDFVGFNGTVECPPGFVLIDGVCVFGG